MIWLGKRIHVGRSFSGTMLEDECECPKAPCGLVVLEDVWNGGCPQHDVSFAKTLRQGHPESECPNGNANG